MNRIITIMTGVLAAFLVASCEKKYFKPEPVDLNAPVSFSADIEPLFQKECGSAGCHNGAVAPNLTTGNCYNALIEGAYVDTLKPAESLLMVKLNTNMPPQKLPAAEIAKVLKWIEQGAQAN